MSLWRSVPSGAFAIGALALLGAVSAAAQPAPPPTRQRAGTNTETTREQTGTIRGRITAADTGAPVRRARVSATAAGVGVFAVTDEEGRYAFAGLSPRRYKVSASRSPFVTMGFGQRHPNGPARLYRGVVPSGRHCLNRLSY